MNIGIAFFHGRIQTAISTFTGFILGGYSGGKTDTDQTILSVTSGHNVTVSPFSGEPYFPASVGRVDALDYEKNNKVFVLGSRNSSVTPYSSNGGTIWSTSISHPFTSIVGISHGLVSPSLLDGFFAYGTNNSTDSTDLIRFALSTSMHFGWNSVSHPTMTAIIGMATNGSGVWLAVGTVGTGTNSNVLYSTNAATFHDIPVSPPTFSSGAYAVAYGQWHNGVSHSPAWVVAGLNGGVSALKYTFTADGSSGWTAEGSLTIDIVALATDGDAKWVVVGQNSQDVYYSGDYGASWALATLNVGTDTYNGISVAYGLIGVTPTWILTGQNASSAVKTRYSTTNGSSWNDLTFVAPAEEFTDGTIYGGLMVKYIS